QFAGTSELATIDLTTGATTIINSDFADITKGGGLAFSTAGGLYLSPSGSSGTLWAIDPTTGAATAGPTLDFGLTNNYINALAYSTANSTLYGVNSDVFPSP